MRLRFLLAVFATVLACGDPETEAITATSAGAGGVDDGLLRPATNGVQILENEACTIVKNAVSQRWTTLGCGPQTLRECPLFLTIMPQHSPACTLYDEGAAQGCAAYYGMMSCDELKASAESCVVANYPGTEPAGCP
jgi:hypothetical protein